VTFATKPSEPANPAKSGFLVTLQKSHETIPFVCFD
jgi:hypothetical protein